MIRQHSSGVPVLLFRKPHSSATLTEPDRRCSAIHYCFRWDHSGVVVRGGAWRSEVISSARNLKFLRPPGSPLPICVTMLWERRSSKLKYFNTLYTKILLLQLSPLTEQQEYISTDWGPVRQIWESILKECFNFLLGLDTRFWSICWWVLSWFLITGMVKLKAPSGNRSQIVLRLIFCGKINERRGADIFIRLFSFVITEAQLVGEPVRTFSLLSWTPNKNVTHRNISYMKSIAVWATFW